MFVNRLISYIFRKYFYLINKNKFAYLSPTAVVQKLLRVDGKKNIVIENGVVIQKMCWLAAVPLTNAPACQLKIGRNSIIGNFNHIYATGEITIGEDVLTADKVYIADNQHNYVDVNIPIHKQGILQHPPVFIGSGTWIGENVCVLGASIGRNCVIGANSVVTKDIPDFSVAVGAPARVIKRFDLPTQSWINVK